MSTAIYFVHVFTPIVSCLLFMMYHKFDYFEALFANNVLFLLL